MLKKYKLRSKARKAARNHQWKEAARYYREICKQRHPSVKDQVQFGHALKESGQFDIARSVYTQAADTNPHYVDAQKQAGLFLKLQGDKEAAAAYFARALALDDTLNELHDELRSCGIRDELTYDLCHLRGALTSTDCRNQATSLLTHLRMVLPLKRARRAARKTIWSKAETNYKQVLKQNPNQVGALVQLGHALREQGKSEEAIKKYRYALLLTPRDPDVYIHLGAALKQAGRADSALAAYLAAWRLKPNIPSAVGEIRGFCGNLTDEQIAELTGMYLRMDTSKQSLPSSAVNQTERQRLVELEGLQNRQNSIFKLLAGSLVYKD